MQIVLTVQAMLEGKVSSTDYVVGLKVFVDGNEMAKSWNDFVLTIRN
jgi:hypothetical protein